MKASRTGKGQPLEPGVRTEMEERFQADFHHVRVHDDARAHASAGELEAKAYTQGADIVFSRGRFAPGSIEGRKLLAHELAHVIQQGRGGSAPDLNPHSALEQSAHAAGDAAATSSGPVCVAGASGVGIAREPEEEEEEKGASMTVLGQRRSQSRRAKRGDPLVEINDPRKGKGTLGEVTVPWALYSGPEWNHIGGGEETKSSRTSLARESSFDKRHGRGPSAGIDFIVENMETGRLVIGEQKALGAKEFTDATAITTNLEKNLDHAISTLRGKIQRGEVHPDSVTHLERTIARLEATRTALRNRTELPPGVVFELTNLNGKSEQIGKPYIDLLRKKYGDRPGFVEHLLGRTFVRDPALAKAKGKDAGGKRGTDTDPNVVPANEVLTPPAKDELARLKSGKSEKAWKAQQKKEKAATEKAEKGARMQAAADKRRQDREAREKAKRDAKTDARRQGEEARDAHKKKAEAERRPADDETAKQRREQQRKIDREAREAGKKAQKDAEERWKAQQKAKREQEAAQRKAADEAKRKVREADIEARRKQQADNDAGQRRAHDEHANRKPPPDTPESLRKMQKKAETDSKVARATKAVNDLAAGLRTYDAWDKSRQEGKGVLESGYEAGKTWLENTNVVFGAVANRENKLKDGQDPVESWLSTIGETGANFIVPGGAVDQGINALGNLVGAVDDHQNRKDPNHDPSKASVRDATDLAVELTPSRMFSQTMGAGIRSYWNIGKVLGGDSSGIDKFGDDAVKGKLSPIFQAPGMLFDFAGNLGGNDAETAFNKTLEKSKGSTLEKLGSASGDAVFNLGQDERAKAGDKGTVLQGWSMLIGLHSDHIAGKDWDQSLADATRPGEDTWIAKVGGAGGEAAYKGVEKAKEVWNEDIPAARKYVSGKIDEGRDKAGEAKDYVEEKVDAGIDKAKEVWNEDLPAAREAAKDYARDKYNNTSEKLGRAWDKLF